METSHQPVMLAEVLSLAGEAFQFQKQQPGQGAFQILDGTLGAGGHSLSLARAYPDACLLMGDRDSRMIERARQNFEKAGMDPGQDRFSWQRSRASEIDVKAHRSKRCAADYQGLDFALLDLGISMLHLKEFQGGFSYEDESLDMRLDEDLETSASDLINELPEKELADLIYKYGEERASRKIAHRIVQSRPVQSATRLAEIIARAVPGPRNRAHPARKTFQALRIAVNDELQEAELAARNLSSQLSPGGILAIITFHSLEDRIIKQCFAELCGAEPGVSRYDAPVAPLPRAAPEFEKAIRKSMAPSSEELEQNQASRSARLRAIRRIHPKEPASGQGKSLEKTESEQGRSASGGDYEN